jgi:hypothetical protein
VSLGIRRDARQHVAVFGELHILDAHLLKFPNQKLRQIPLPIGAGGAVDMTVAGGMNSRVAHKTFEKIIFKPFPVSIYCLNHALSPLPSGALSRIL